MLPSVVNISVSNDNATWDDIHSGTLPRDLATDTAYTYSYKNPDFADQIPLSFSGQAEFNIAAF